MALAAQIILPTTWPDLQLIGDGTTAASYAENAVVLGGITITLVTMVNCLKVRVVGLINNVAVSVELILGVVLIVALFANHKHSPTVAFNTLGTGSGHSTGYFGAFIVATIFGAYEFFGFDTAGSLAEESPDPHRSAPRAIIRAMGVTFRC